MKKIFIFVILIPVSLAFLAQNVKCAEFLVKNPSELHNALATAQSNGVPDVIRVSQGIYFGNFSPAFFATPGLAPKKNKE